MMKTVFLGILTGFLIAISSIASAETDEKSPMLCDDSKKIFELLKKKKFVPVLIGESDNVQTAIFLNAEKDMIIAFTAEENNKHITCVVVGGEKNTQVFRLPQETNQ